MLCHITSSPFKSKTYHNFAATIQRLAATMQHLSDAILFSPNHRISLAVLGITPLFRNLTMCYIAVAVQLCAIPARFLAVLCKSVSFRSYAMQLPLVTKQFQHVSKPNPCFADGFGTLFITPLSTMVDKWGTVMGRTPLPFDFFSLLQLTLCVNHIRQIFLKITKKIH